MPATSAMTIALARAARVLTDSQCRRARPARDGAGQLEREARAVRAARREQAAVHALGQLARDREAEAGAARGCPGPAVEALEDALEQLRRDARAVVGDDDARAPGRRLGAQRDRGAGRRVAHGVVHEHAQHLEHAALVAARERRGSRHRPRRRTRGAPRAPASRAPRRRASSPSSISSWATVKPPASSRERSSRSVASFVSRCTCSPIVSRNSLRSASVRPPSVSSSR